jgi:tRNA G46 methylase TrmB
MIKDNTVDEMYETLRDDGVVYFITDVKDVFDDFCTHLSTKFKQISYHDIDEKSHWEKWREKNNKTIYRACFVK